VEEACDTTIAVTDVTEPRPEMADLYNEMYKTYGGLYPSLRGHFKEIAKVVG